MTWKAVGLSFFVLAILGVVFLHTDQSSGGVFLAQHSKVSRELQQDVPVECTANKLVFLEMVHSNLGGLGPDTGDESLVFNNVFPDSGENIQLKVKTLSPYVPANILHNKVSGAYGQINLQADSSVNLSFQFVNATTNEPVAIGPFMMSFLDFDTPKSGGAEMVTISGFARFQTWQNTEIQVEEGAMGTSFSSTIWGTGTDNPADPLLLTELQKQRTVELFFPKSSELNVTLAMRTTFGSSGRNIMFTGPTSLSCPERTTTTTTINELGHESQEEPEECKTNKLRLLDMVHSNLGGHGPDTGNESLVFENVFPDVGESIRLTVTALSSYTPANTKQNKVTGVYGQINLQAASTVKLNFQFTRATTDEPVAIGPFMMSFLDFDTPKRGGAEVVMASGFTRFQTTTQSDILVEERMEGTAFSSTKWGTIKDNPTDPLLLSELQKQRTLELFFPQTSELILTLEMQTPKGTGGRNVMFTGPTSLSCLERSTTTTTTTIMDEQQLCTDNMLDLSKLVHSNLGGHGPDSGEETMVFSNVFPSSGEDVKLVVSAVGAYKPKNSRHNKVRFGMAQINVVQNSEVALMFSFVKAMDGSQVTVDPFMMSLLDFDKSRGGMQETVTVTGFSDFHLSANTEVGVNTVNGALTFTATKAGKVADDPQDAFQLTDKQLKRSVSVLYPAVSHFHVTLKVPSRSQSQAWGRNFFFAGPTNLMCELVETTTTTTVTTTTTTTSTTTTSSTTTTTTQGPMGLCSLVGDPHIKPFDSNKQNRRYVDIFTYGEYWVVKSQSVLIQGRYGAAHRSGNSRVAALAVGGHFLGGHTLIIEIGQTLWDGQPILTTLPSELSAPSSLLSASAKHMANGAKLQFKLPQEVTITINRWKTHLDVLILMRRVQGGQDGHCGNFNSNALDDTKTAIVQRIGQQIPEAELLFPSKAPEVPQPVEQTLENCIKRNEALAVCQGHLGSNADVEDLEACAMDFCFGDEGMAANWGATLNMWKDEDCQSKKLCRAGAGTTPIAVADSLGKSAPRSQAKCLALCRELAAIQGYTEKSCCAWTTKPRKVCKSVQSPITDQWCNDNCNHNPPFCPSSCRCNKESSCQLFPPDFRKVSTNAANRHVCVLGATR